MATFNRTLTIEGIKVKPRWNWTKDYEKTVRAGMRDGGDCLTRHEAAEKIAVKYARWIAERDGIDLARANHTVCQWHHVNVPRGISRSGRQRMAYVKVAIEAVEFRNVERPSWYGNRWWEPHTVVATIAIPFSTSPPVAVELEELAA